MLFRSNMVVGSLFSKARHDLPYGSHRISQSHIVSSSIAVGCKFPWRRRSVSNRQRLYTADTCHSSHFGITSQTRTMSTNFASSTYASAFQCLPKADGLELRTRTLAYLDTFDLQKWSDEPVRTIFRNRVNDDILQVQGRSYR